MPVTFVAHLFAFGPRTSSTAGLLEIEANLIGAAAIATDLASALFVTVVRIHLQREGANRGLLGLLAHRQLGEAVRAMLEEPARSWSLNELAARANASRASFVRMFQRVAQRVELASRKLRNTSLALSDVAAEAGYQFGKLLQPRVRAPLRPPAGRAACRAYLTTSSQNLNPPAESSLTFETAS